MIECLPYQPTGICKIVSNKEKKDMGQISVKESCRAKEGSVEIYNIKENGKLQDI